MAQRYVASVEQLEGILLRLAPALGPLEGAPEPLSGGITNHNFRVTLGGRDYVIRVHGKDTQLLGIDRHAEQLAVNTAAELGIAPAVVAALDDCLVTRYIANDPLSPRDVSQHAHEIGRALRSFHDAGAQLPTSFWVPDLLERYAAIVRASGGALPQAYAETVALTVRIAASVPLAQPRACHNDLLTSNLIRARDSGHILVVDWEYAGMGHTGFDLGNLSVNNDFDEAADERLLSSYHGQPPSDAGRATLKLMRILSDAREAAWGVVQAHISELDFDFKRYADSHFERLLGATEQAPLEQWLAVAGANAREERHGPAT
jgi:thiamine kinase-like enzyme